MQFLQFIFCVMYPLSNLINKPSHFFSLSSLCRSLLRAKCPKFFSHNNFPHPEDQMGNYFPFELALHCVLCWLTFTNVFIYLVLSPGIKTKLLKTFCQPSISGLACLNLPDSNLISQMPLYGSYCILPGKSWLLNTCRKHIIIINWVF